MNQEGYIQAFHAWIRRNKQELLASGITVQVPEKIIPSGTYAEFFSRTGEATVEVWDYGFSEFHVLDVETDQINVTHYEFQSKEELYMRLEALVHRLMTNLALAG